MERESGAGSMEEQKQNVPRIRESDGETVGPIMSSERATLVFRNHFEMRRDFKKTGMQLKQDVFERYWYRRKYADALERIAELEAMVELLRNG